MDCVLFHLGYLFPHTFTWYTLKLRVPIFFTYNSNMKKVTLNFSFAPIIPLARFWMSVNTFPLLKYSLHTSSWWNNLHFDLYVQKPGLEYQHFVGFGFFTFSPVLFIILSFCNTEIFLWEVLNTFHIIFLFDGFQITAICVCINRYILFDTLNFLILIFQIKCLVLHKHIV